MPTYNYFLFSLIFFLTSSSFFSPPLPSFFSPCSWLPTSYSSELMSILPSKILLESNVVPSNSLANIYERMHDSPGACSAHRRSGDTGDMLPPTVHAHIWNQRNTECKSIKLFEDQPGITPCPSTVSCFGQGTYLGTPQELGVPHQHTFS